MLVRREIVTDTYLYESVKSFRVLLRPPKIVYNVPSFQVSNLFTFFRVREIVLGSIVKLIIVLGLI